MTILPNFTDGTPLIIVRWCRGFRPGPILKDGEEAADVLYNLSRVFMAECPTRTRLPHSKRFIAQIVVSWFRYFHKKTQPTLRRAALLAFLDGSGMHSETKAIRTGNSLPATSRQPHQTSLWKNPAWPSPVFAPLVQGLRRGSGKTDPTTKQVIA
jgi:hypothetical protein